MKRTFLLTFLALSLLACCWAFPLERHQQDQGESTDEGTRLESHRLHPEENKRRHEEEQLLDRRRPAEEDVEESIQEKPPRSDLASEDKRIREESPEEKTKSEGETKVEDTHVSMKESPERRGDDEEESLESPEKENVEEEELPKGAAESPEKESSEERHEKEEQLTKDVPDKGEKESSEEKELVDIVEGETIQLLAPVEDGGEENLVLVLDMQVLTIATLETEESGSKSSEESSASSSSEEDEEKLKAEELPGMKQEKKLTDEPSNQSIRKKRWPQYTDYGEPPTDIILDVRQGPPPPFNPVPYEPGVSIDVL